MPASMSSTGVHEAVGTPAAAMTSLANAFEPSRRAAARVGPNAARPRDSSSSTRPATSGASGPTTVRSTASRSARSASAPTSPMPTSGKVLASSAMPGLPGAARTSGPCGERWSARTIACSRPPAPTTRTRGPGIYRLAMKSSMGIATSVSYRDVPREPSSSETRAIVLSSGASTTLMKSNWPSVAHWAFTLAPSCSTSLLTSRMRCGLFLTVWTPSGVSVESMTYVGIDASWLAVAVVSIPFGAPQVAWPPVTVLAQLSDPHVDVGPGDTGSAEALAAAVEAVLRVDPAPDAVLLSGDLTNLSDARSYERVRELLAPLPMPVHVLPGNHDDREALRAWFTDDAVEGPDGDPFRYAVRCGVVRLVVCDTTQPGRDAGRLDAGARAWLESQLAAEPDMPTIVAMHHTPLLTGIGAMDAIGLPEADREALALVLSRFRCVRRVVGGHVHRACFGLLGRCPVFACPSTHLQVALSSGSELSLEIAPPSFALHVVLAGGEVVTLVQPVRSGALSL